MASFSVSGLVPISAAIAGRDVAMTVESMFSMNSAVATMSGIRRCLFMRNTRTKRFVIEAWCIPVLHDYGKKGRNLFASMWLIPRFQLLHGGAEKPVRPTFMAIL